jgi:hypothetical protein
MYEVILDGLSDLGYDMALVLWNEKAPALKIVVF